MSRSSRTSENKEKKKNTAKTDYISNEIDNLAICQKDRLNARAKMEERNLEIAFKILLCGLRPIYLKKTIGQLRSEIISLSATSPSSLSPSRDDGYLTQNSSEASGELEAKRQTPLPKSSRPKGSRSRPRGNRSRSVDRTPRVDPTPSNTMHGQRSRSVYRTPVNTKNEMSCYPVITPKITPNTTVTVLRQPRQGEMVVSLSGSPVMVSSCYTLNRNEMANCNIQLHDGTTLSLLPKELRKSQAYIPFSLMDSEVLQQLKTLKDNLDKVVELGKKAGIN